MDSTQKKIGNPFSTSRKMEKAMKKKTNKARRSGGKLLTREVSLAQALGLDSISDRWANTPDFPHR